MLRRLAILLVVLVGCGPSAQEQYDTALSIVNRQQERLDALRPAYDAARQSAVMVVCKEIAGVTPDESATAALQQMQSAMSQAVDTQASAKPATNSSNVGDINATIDNLLAAQETLTDQHAALSLPIRRVNEVMNKINMPGTPEAKRFEEVLAAKPEVQAYRRQEERLARAKEAADAAEAALPKAATK
jgi:hypothetical protein